MNHYIKRIEISGFKSCRSVAVDLKPVNVLIGANGAGKSNVLSLFRFLRALFSGNLQQFGMQSNAATLFYNGIKITDAIKLSVVATEAEYRAVVKLADDGRLYLQHESLKDHSVGYESNVLPESSLRFLKTEDADDNDILHCRLVTPDNWRVYHFNDTSRSARIKQDQSIVNCEGLLEDGANLAPFLFRLQRFYRGNYQRIVYALQRVAPYFDDFVLVPTNGGNDTIRLKWRQKGCDDVFDVAQLSDGTLRFLCLATLLLQPLELQPGLIVIDEPELGLHPYALTLFSGLMRSAAVDRQIVVATQSVELLNEFDLEEVLVVDRRDDGTQLSRLNENDLAIWLQEDYSLGELWQKNLLGGRLSR